ncbi:hypothetical protein C2G38_2206959 [Gigaspora rosea]|uniref:Uncharacterized protein n=1 Tax=Gigaspora rosea TaxID=44941 RepID=A0A397ULW3_9GLOM|nr:hypothetical protein C2G38_2206959 [Gigaspora rosea]
MKKNLETIKYVSNNNMEEPTFTLYIEILTKALYQIQHIEGANLELDLVKYEHMIEATNPQLKGFVQQICKSTQARDWVIFNAIRETWEAINMMSTLGYLKDLDDDENDVEEGADKVSKEIEEALDTSSRLAAEIYKIEHW